MLLTNNGLCRRDKRRAGAARLRFYAPGAGRRRAGPALAMRKMPLFWPITASCDATSERLNKGGLLLRAHEEGSAAEERAAWRNHLDLPGGRAGRYGRGD